MLENLADITDPSGVFKHRAGYPHLADVIDHPGVFKYPFVRKTVSALCTDPGVQSGGSIAGKSTEAFRKFSHDILRDKCYRFFPGIHGYYFTGYIVTDVLHYFF